MAPAADVDNGPPQGVAQFRSTGPSRVPAAKDDRMQIHITHALPEEGLGSGPVNVAWLLADKHGVVIYDAPARVGSAAISQQHANSASRCPAIIGLESRYFEVPCPFDLHIAFVRYDGKPNLVNRLGQQSPIRSQKLACPACGGVAHGGTRRMFGPCVSGSKLREQDILAVQDSRVTPAPTLVVPKALWRCPMR